MKEEIFEVLLSGSRGVSPQDRDGTLPLPLNTGEFEDVANPRLREFLAGVSSHLDTQADQYNNRQIRNAVHATKVVYPYFISEVSSRLRTQNMVSFSFGSDENRKVALFSKETALAIAAVA